ncbi:hypothetical protein [Spiroplasma clarkii]|uniref:Uncharacterized protein n=1 Tax=Spiroplasma clarkii TaxID=2139 RepID=A0A2K8KJY3_9MOLU|nr:hypothetical protein [Spiroplasma clarkii]ATX70719.1 hypothetical protein SCLAR_v1c03890 [Spiroplasma clarkii]
MKFTDQKNKYGLNQKQQYHLYVKVYGQKINNLFEEKIKTEFKVKEIEYTMLRDYFRYDKRIRKVFYKYIELYEENLKSIFYDKTIWENNLFVLSPDLKNYSSIYEINKTDKNYYSLGRLKDILFIMKLIDEQKVQEIDRVIDLRNNIAHYNLLVLHLDELQDLIAGFLTSMTKQIKRQVLQDLDDCKLGLVDLKNLYLKNYTHTKHRR